MFDVPESMIRENMFGLGYKGICLSCGDVRGECEPDARKYECWNCGEYNVYGLEEALMMGAINLVPDEE